MSYLITDLNSIASSAMLVGKDPDRYKAGGEDIPTFDYGYGNFIKTFRKTLDVLDIKPHQVIGVFDARKSRKKRQKIYSEYKAHRVPRPDEYYEEFNKLMDEIKRLIRHLGGIIVSVRQMEADDVIAHIAPKLPNSIIWSKDKDLLSIGTMMYLDGQLYTEDSCDDRFLGLDRKYVPLYRTLVSDSGDFGPGMGAKGFGEKAFLNMWASWGDEGLDSMIDIIENKNIKSLAEDVGELTALSKIIDSEKNVYTTWKLANWLPIEDHKLVWEPGYVHTFDNDLDFVESYGTQTLITEDNFDSLKNVIKEHILESPFVALDIESDVYEESLEWIAAIQANIRKDAMRVDVLESQLCGLAITVGDNSQHTYYFSVCHKDTNNIESEKLRDFLVPLLSGRQVLCHNASGFELPVLKKNWDIWLPNVHDTQIAAGYVDENDWVNLKHLSKKNFHYNQQSYESVIGDDDGMSDKTGEEVLSYGCDDTIMTAALYNFFRVVMLIEGTFNVFDMVESDSQYLTAYAFVNGVNCDLKVLEDLKEKDEELYDKNYEVIEKYLIEIGWDGAVFLPIKDLTAKEIKRAVYMMTGEVFKTSFRKIEKVIEAINKKYPEGPEEFTNLLVEGDLDAINLHIADNFMPTVEFKTNSPKQVSTLLYEYMQVPIRYRNKLTDLQRENGQDEGAPSTDEDSIKWAMERDTNDEEKTVLKSLLACKAARTRNSLYYNPYKYLVHWSDGKLHPSLKQASTTSRRFAPTGPNVNQQPKRKEEGKKIRRCVVPHKPKATIISPDFTGQELRLGAHASQDANFLACYIGDNLKDLHSITGFAINEKQGYEYEDEEAFIEAVKGEKPLAKKYRGKGKDTNFLAQYGGSSFTLGKKLIVDEDEAQKFLDARAAAFPELTQWAEDYTNLVLEQKYAETLLGARKHVHKLIGVDGSSINHILRSALNFRIQSSAAEMTKLVMGRIWRSGILNRYDAVFYFPVHDELCFSVANCDLEDFCRELRPLMESQYADMIVPIISSLAVGPNFGELKERDWPEEKVAA